MLSLPTTLKPAIAIDFAESPSVKIKIHLFDLEPPPNSHHPLWNFDLVRLHPTVLFSDLLFLYSIKLIILSTTSVFLTNSSTNFSILHKLNQTF